MASLFDISVRVFEKFFEEGFSSLNQAEQTLVCIRALVGEVDNGGFHAWLYNSSGEYAAETPESLVRICAYNTAKIVLDALDGAGDIHIHRDGDARRDRLEAFTEEQDLLLDKLDARFARRSEDLETLLQGFVKDNRDCFDD